MPERRSPEVSASRIWSAVTGLVLMAGALSAMLLLPPSAAAQVEPPEVTATPSCLDHPTIQGQKMVEHVVLVENPNAEPISYTVVRTFTEGVPNRTVPLAVPANGENSHLHRMVNASQVALSWTVTTEVLVDGDAVVEPIVQENPCVAPPPSSSSSSSEPSSSSSPTSSSSETSDPSATTTTDDPPLSTTTDDLPTTTTGVFVDVTSTPPGGVDTVASTGGGGGLASTGVALAAITGVGAVLLFNGLGLMRVLRRGGDDD